MKYFTIKENSFVAKLAAKKLRSKSVAIVFGNRIHLYGVKGTVFMNNQRWLRHELKHIEQYQRLGFVGFIAAYLWQTIRFGYYKCPLEREARAAEEDGTLTGKFELKPDVSNNNLT